MVMKFLFCFPRRRRRIAYSISSTNVYYLNSPSSAPTVTFGSPPSSNNKPVVSSESLYESIRCSSGNGKIGSTYNHQTSVTSQEYGGYATVSSKTMQPKCIVMDETGLYATIDKSRQAKNRIGMQRNSSSTANASAMSQSMPPLPPLSTLPLQAHTNAPDNTLTNARYGLSSSQHRRPQNLFNLSERKITTTSSELYAEIANSSASGTINSSHPSSPSARSFNESGTYVTISEFDATVAETDSTEGESNTSRAVISKGDYMRF